MNDSQIQLIILLFHGLHTSAQLAVPEPWLSYLYISATSPKTLQTRVDILTKIESKIML